MNPRTRPSGPVDRAFRGYRLVKSWRFLATVVLLIGLGLTVHVAPAMAQLPDLPGQLPDNPPAPPPVSKPVCVSCGSGYHCVHDPEGCEADDPPLPPIDPKPPLEQPE
jgi:hypothetical protein